MPKDTEQKDRPRVVVEEVPQTTETPVATEEVKAPEEVKPVEELMEGKEIPKEVEMETKAESLENSKPTEIEEKQKQTSPVLWIIIPGIFILGALLGGIVFYQKGVNKGETVATPTPSATTSASPSASPAAPVNLTKYSIAILNGSGISGEAGKAKTLLTTAGFEVSTTGNAATYDFTKTVIKAKAEVDAAFTTALSTALGKTYVVDTLQTLPASSTIKVQVTIGSSKAE